MVKHRLGIVEQAGGNINAAEQKLGGMIESAIEEAKTEEVLAGKMAEWKS